MSKNVVVSFAEGYSDDLDVKKNRGLYDFRSRFGGGGMQFRTSTRIFFKSQCLKFDVCSKFGDCLYNEIFCHGGTCLDDF